MTRLYGRAPRGERVSERVPRNYGSHTSVISTLSLAGPEAVWTVEGAVDTDAFNVYVERVLRPTMRRGDILVLDNLRHTMPAASRRWPRSAGPKSSGWRPTRRTSRR
jgi:hypothetical protein